MSDSETIDLDYRPSSYFRPQPLEDYRLGQVKSELVRAHLRELLASERHDEVARILREEGVSDDQCRALERIHPLFMGGNYLPGLRPGEVEIARIFIQSTTGDVTAVYARRVGDRIRYRVVDEYDGETLEGKTTRDSAKPLTLDALHDFLTDGWGFHSVLDMNFEGDVEGMLGFFVAESDFYPQLDALCRQRVLEAFPLQEDEEDEEDDPDDGEDGPSGSERLRGSSRHRAEDGSA
jgi:hypothetical protein